MGIREGNNWTFYLQENVTVTVTYLTKQHWYSKKVPVHRVYSRPIIFRQIYPGTGFCHMNRYTIPPRLD